MKPIVLTIMDGVGIAKPGLGNAFDLAKKPNLDKLFAMYPHTTLDASGQRVGLPAGQMGNSEVGHMNIGAGRVVYQQLELINKSFRENTVKENKTYLELVNFAKSHNNVVHVFGLLSDGGVHSHIDHFKAMVELLDSEGIKVLTHAIYDGRDVGPKTAMKYLTELDELAKKLDNGYVQTGCGRYYGMDRDTNYERTEKSYQAIINGIGDKVASAKDGLQISYDNNIVDEFVNPYVIDGYEGAKNGDAFILMNFRPDRAIQISNAIINPDFDNFDRTLITDTYYASMTKYTRVDSHVLFQADSIENGLGEYLSTQGYKQLRIAETEKYAHVTFFFDGGVEKDYPGLSKVLVDSPKVATYDMQPEMSALEVCEQVVRELDKDYDVVILNFANPDMVGHTGDIPATIKAVETVDYCVGKVYEKVQSLGGVMLITADHGNSEMLLDDEGNVVTSHTTNLVPLCLTKADVKLKEDMSLCDIAPTILELLGAKQPAEMTGNTIILEEK